jgi:hypothetical protein
MFYSKYGCSYLLENWPTLCKLGIICVLVSECAESCTSTLLEDVRSQILRSSDSQLPREESSLIGRAALFQQPKFQGNVAGLYLA